MTQNLSKELLKALPAMCRASFEISPVLYASGTGDESGGELTTEMRDELLRKCAAGEYVAVDIDMLAYEQRDGVRNRNSVRFRNEAIIALGNSGKNKPFLKDHEQWDSEAVAGRIIACSGKKLAEGQYEIRARARLTAPWAVALACRGLLFAVSIGWDPEGPIECSVCKTAIYTKCYHWPGDTVTEVPQSDGTKKYVWDRNGVLKVEWVYTKASLKEISCCPIGGVKLAGVGGVRAALAAAGMPVELAIMGDDITDEEFAAAIAARESLADKSTRIEPVPQPALTPTEEPMADLKLILAVLSAAHFAHYQTLAPADAEAFAQKPVAERDAILAAKLNADPVKYTAKNGTVYRESQAQLADLAKQADDNADQLASERAARAKDLLTAEAKALLSDKQMHGSVEVHAAILGAVKAIENETLRASCVQSLIAWTNGGQAKPAPGVNPEIAPLPDGPQAQFDALVAAHEKEHKCSTRDARLAVSKTEQGRALYNEIELAKKSRK